jgi:small subunit ribosomal protein S5
MDKKTNDTQEILNGVDLVSEPAVVSPALVLPDADKSGKLTPRLDRKNSRGRDLERKGGRRMASKEPRVKPEFDQKIITIRRVARVVAGGRRFAFSVALVSGNRKGMVGIGLGKGADTALAIEKATRNAKKHMVAVPLTASGSIPFEVSAKYASSVVMIMPAPGRGVVAGTSVRNVLELAGMKEVTAKLRSGSKNRLNNARAALKALSFIANRAPVILDSRKVK